MFNDKPYFEINREERHFGFLLGSLIIHNHVFAGDFFARCNELTGSNLYIDDFDIFMEVAALRDYWNNLGNYEMDYETTRNRRREVLEQILNTLQFPTEIIDKEKVFWTNEKTGKGKLWSPAQWNVNDLRKIETDYKKKNNNLVNIRWCFRAKPDILIVSNGSAVFIEVKVESLEGKNDIGYNQFEVQKQIAKWMKKLIPEFHNKQFFNTTLTLEGDKEKPGIIWKEVIEMAKKYADESPGSRYSAKCLEALLRYYK